MAQMKTVTKWPYWVTQHGNEILFHDEDFKSHSVLDWYTDVGVNSFLSAPDWLRTILRQVPPVHVPHILMSQPRAHLAHMLCGIHDMDEVFFSNDGTEAVETTIKLARKWHYDQHSEKVYIWAQDAAFHGRTYGALSATFTAGVSPYHHDGFGPEVPNFKSFKRIEDIDFALAQAVIISPIFGNNDVIPIKKEVLQRLRHRCDSSNTLLIFDEVQSGMGRCGDWSAASLYGIKPDIMCFAKGIAAGMPLGATLARKEYCSLTPGSHFNTFGGNNISCLMALKVIEELDGTGKMDTIVGMGHWLAGELMYVEGVKEVRQVGLMLALDTEFDSRAFGDIAIKHGLLCGSFRSNTLKIYPPLDMSLSAMKEALYRFKNAVKEVMS